MPARLTVLSGPSGVGKGTVVARVRAMYPQLWVSVSATTRHPRPGERDGVHYRFVDRATFEALAASGDLLEHAEFAGNHYGTPRQPVLDHLADDVPTLLEIELDGARQMRRTMPQAQFVFLAPPSIEVLVARLARRGTESPEVQQARLERARIELAAESEFDVVVVNDDLERAARDVAALVSG